MIRKMASYRVQKDKVDSIVKSLDIFVNAIKKNESRTNYLAYRVDDTNEFIHIMSFIDGLDEEKHRNAEYTCAFVNELFPVCEEEPKFYDVTLVSKAHG